jgi:hypothetical protein
VVVLVDSLEKGFIEMAIPKPSRLESLESLGKLGISSEARERYSKLTSGDLSSREVGL